MKQATTSFWLHRKDILVNKSRRIKPNIGNLLTFLGLDLLNEPSAPWSNTGSTAILLYVSH